MEHAYHGEDGHPIQVVVPADDAQVAIELLHSGEAFTPESVPPSSFDGCLYREYRCHYYGRFDGA